jgi:hypothetical protein
MINHERGDILEFFRSGKVNTVLHCANCQGVMGSGIALQIKNQFPEAYKSYRLHEETSGLKLGTNSFAGFQNGYIFNLHAQKNYGTQCRQVNYEALYRCFEGVREELIGLNFKGIIGIPYKMASDRAGGSWIVVNAMIQDVFKGFEVLIVEYKNNL